MLLWRTRIQLLVVYQFARIGWMDDEDEKVVIYTMPMNDHPSLSHRSFEIHV